jgi:hypothetical protein
MMSWTTISVKKEIKKRLDEFMKMKGLSSSNDAIAFLLDYIDIYSKIENMLKNKLKDSTRKNLSSTASSGR